MGVTVKSHFNITAKKAAIVWAAQVELRRQLADQVARIDKDTQRGKDIHGATFKEYSGYNKGKRQQHAGYARWRQRQKYRVNPPNLTVTGEMLNALTHTVRRNGWRLEGKVKFFSAKAATKAQHNIDNKRLFFGLSEKRSRQMKRAIERAIRQAVSASATVAFDHN